MKFQGRKVSESRGYNLMFFLDDVNQFRVSSIKKYKSFKDLNNFMWEPEMWELLCKQWHSCIMEYYATITNCLRVLLIYW